MAKKIFNIALKIIIPIFIFLMQIFVFNKELFLGIKANLCVVFILLIIIFNEKNKAICYAIFLGTISDIFFSKVFGKYIAIYLIITIIVFSIKKRYKEDSKMMLILYSIYGTIIFEIMEFIFFLFNTGTFVNVFNFLLLLFKECIINIALMFLMYIVFRRVYKDE